MGQKERAMNMQPAPGKGIQLNAGTLLDRARAQANLKDFGDEWFMGPLEAIVRMSNAEAGLKSDNGFPVQFLVGMLADRLKLVDYLKRHPKVHDEKLDVAGVIIGLGRGGSTLLHRLITASPQLTAVHIWEWMNPVPLPDEPPGNPSKRIDMGIAAVKATYEFWPEMVAMHPMVATDYDEDLQLLDRTLLSMMYPFYFNIPSYVPWMFAQDHSKAFEELRTWLKLLQYQKVPDRRGRKWFLKSGHYLACGHLEAVINAFPEAKLVMTHRRMENVLASFCSMQTLTVKQDSLTFDQRTTGPNAIAWFQEVFKRMFEVRKKYPADKFIDIFYKDVITDPQGQFRNGLERMGLKVTAADEAAARTWMASHGRETHPPHKYTPEDFGVTGEQIAAAFKVYHDAFIPKK
jgi:hypothetical protein